RAAAAPRSSGRTRPSRARRARAGRGSPKRRCRTRRRARLAPASRRGDASPPPEELFGRLLGFGLFAAVLALAGRDRDLLGLGRRAGDQRDVDLVLVLARDEDGRVRL